MHWIFQKRQNLSHQRREMRDNLWAIPWYGLLIYTIYLIHKLFNYPYIFAIMAVINIILLIGIISRGISGIRENIKYGRSRGATRLFNRM